MASRLIRNNHIIDVVLFEGVINREVCGVFEVGSIADKNHCGASINLREHSSVPLAD
jgi:hypothetical protein